MRDRTAAQWYALVFGGALLAAGIVGFFVNASFDNVGGDVEGDKLIWFEVNGWHNVVHLVSGLIGLSVWGRQGASRAYALGFGVVYLAVAVIGGITHDHFFGVLAINNADNWLHLAIAIPGIIAGLVSPSGLSRRRTESVSRPVARSGG